MTQKTILVSGGPIFDGTQLHTGQTARFVDGRFVGLEAPATVPDDAVVIDLQGDILSPGGIDLQVNGGGGVMFNDDPSPQTLAIMAKAHHGLGTAALLPTLITDRPAVTQAAIAAAISAVAAGQPGIIGLHLEGPHLSIARKGAHDETLIRPMEAQDLALLLEAKASLPVLKVTLAPENATPEQVSTLSQAGILVSLGHTDADYDTCMAYARAGAKCATHLFNAMSQLGHRAPGLVGAVLQNGGLSAGVIADGVHVHPASLRAAWAAKSGPGRLFLVSDAMAVAGTDLQNFTLNGRIIHRKDGQLRLEAGTLAGADLDLITAVRILVQEVGVPLADAMAAATTTPAMLVGLTRHTLTSPGLALCDTRRISPQLTTAKPLI